MLAVSNYSALLLGLETLVCSRSPRFEWAGALLNKESLGRAGEFGASIIVTELDSMLGRECVSLLGGESEFSIVALQGSATEAQIDEAVRKGLKGVVQKQAPNEVLLRAILAVHRGEHWLDRLVTSRILRGLTGESETSSANLLDRLTKRELTIYHAVIKQVGEPIRKLACELHISEHTLRNHLTAIYAKLRVSGRLELLAFARGEQNTNPVSEDNSYS
ncbi:hypothetical protein GCM10022394_00620 [Zobellella aerophila]|uniref:HTH luxR-type domain-containing protein n=1 Tax=Zobellella aerophila TaxID=870480 RepID=A0ABP6UZV6_9GAMM